jgi:hypothetical protein
MKLMGRKVIGNAALATAILLSTAAAQQRNSLVSPRPAAYDPTSETIRQGTVLSYTEDSLVSPIGAHVTVQTSSGTLDVHLGPALYLRVNHFSLSPGDSIRIVGANISVNTGDVFIARIVEKGDQSIVIRSRRGYLQATGAARALPQALRAETTSGSAR